MHMPPDHVGHRIVLGLEKLHRQLDHRGVVEVRLLAEQVDVLREGIPDARGHRVFDDVVLAEQREDGLVQLGVRVPT